EIGVLSARRTVRHDNDLLRLAQFTERRLDARQRVVQELRSIALGNDDRDARSRWRHLLRPLRSPRCRWPSVDHRYRPIQRSEAQALAKTGAPHGAISGNASRWSHS